MPLPNVGKYKSRPRRAGCGDPLAARYYLGLPQRRQAQEPELICPSAPHTPEPRPRWPGLASELQRGKSAALAPLATIRRNPSVLHYLHSFSIPLNVPRPLTRSAKPRSVAYGMRLSFSCAVDTTSLPLSCMITYPYSRGPTV